MLNIVIPMAGRGSRFLKAGFQTPKPFIKIGNKFMIELVINNLRPSMEHRFIFVVLEEHLELYDLAKIFDKQNISFEILAIKEVTDGAAQTVLKAKDLINNDNPLMIANSDQWVDFDVNHYLKTFEESGLDGTMLTMTADDPKWSYVALNRKKNVTKIVEKEVISSEATVGVYNFKEGQQFCQNAQYMIDRNLRSCNEFYVAPVYKFLIEDGKKIGIYNVGSECDGMYGLGTPEDLAFFMDSSVKIKALEF